MTHEFAKASNRVQLVVPERSACAVALGLMFSFHSPARTSRTSCTAPTARTARRVVAAAAVVSLTLVHVQVAHAQASHISRVSLGVGADETQANVAWQSRVPGEQYLEYWPASQPGTVRSVASKRGAYNAAVFYPHQAAMTGLEPETEYVYRVGDSQRGWSEPASLRTAKSSDSWGFVAFADAQIGVDGKVAEQGAAWDKAVSTAVGEHPDSAFVLQLGDQVEGWGAPVAQYEAFLAPDVLSKYRLAVLKGNHETYGVTPKKHFDDAFFLPNEVGDDANYFFTYNNVLFIGLDSNRNSEADIAAHIEYVERVIAQHGEADGGVGGGIDWVITGFHHAPFSQGTHYTDADVVRLRDKLVPGLSAAGVDVVLNGHDHIYTRTHLMDGINPVISEGAARAGDVLVPKDGEVLYVTTTSAGGGKYYDFQGNDGNTYPRIREERAGDLAHASTARWRQDYSPDYLHVEVSEDALTLTTYNVNTPYVVDKVTVRKEEAVAGESGKRPDPEDNTGAAGNAGNRADTDGQEETSSSDAPALIGVSVVLGLLAVVTPFAAWLVSQGLVPLG